LRATNLPKAVAPLVRNIGLVDITAVRRSAIRWIPAALVAVTLMVGAYWFVAAPVIDQIFRSVADDHCPHLASGEPDRTDQDCHGAWGINEVEAWDREHAAP
jgi:hypothetical protein